MTETGLVDVEASLGAVHDLEFDFLNRGIRFDEWLNAMVEADEIARSAADEWLDGAQTASEDGQFFYGGMGVTVVGTVPAQELGGRSGIEDCGTLHDHFKSCKTRALSLADRFWLMASRFLDV